MKIVRRILFFVMLQCVVYNLLAKESEIATIVEDFNETLVSLQPDFSNIAQDIQDISNNLNEIESELNSEFIQSKTPQWIKTIQLTSPDIIIFFKNDHYYAVATIHSPFYFKILPNDHNLWFDNENNMLGYNGVGKLFHLRLEEPGFYTNR